MRKGRGVFTIDAGTAGGIAEGAQIRVFADRIFSTKSQHLIIRVTEAFPFHSIATGSDDTFQTMQPTLERCYGALVPECPGEIDHTVIQWYGTNKIAKWTNFLAGNFNYGVTQSREASAHLRVRPEGEGYSFELCDPFVSKYFKWVPRQGPTISQGPPFDCILRGIAHYDQHLRRKPDEISDFTSKSLVTLEMYRLRFSVDPQTSRFTVGSENLIVDGNVVLNDLGDREPDTSGRTLYGFKIENRSTVPIYVYLYFFDNSNFSIRKQMPLHSSF